MSFWLIQSLTSSIHPSIFIFFISASSCAQGCGQFARSLQCLTLLEKKKQAQIICHLYQVTAYLKLHNMTWRHLGFTLYCFPAFGSFATVSLLSVGPQFSTISSVKLPNGSRESENVTKSSSLSGGTHPFKPSHYKWVNWHHCTVQVTFRDK